MPFNRTVRVPGIRKAHMIHCTSDVVKLWRNCGSASGLPDIVVYLTADASTVDMHVIENDAEFEVETETDFEIGDWVVVQYDSTKYPGEIIDILNMEIEVSAMHPAGNYFKWPDRKDECEPFISSYC